jgi:hypothetical protein
MDDATLDAHFSAFDRLTNADKMGLLFKAIALAPQATLLPPGFSVSI